MNAPEDADLFYLKDGQNKVDCIPDSIMVNSELFVLNLEDHTLGNLLRMELLKYPDVKFAGYRMPHPLENKVELKVQAKDKNPKTVLQNALDNLMNKVNNLSRTFAKKADEQKKTGIGMI